MTEALAFAGEGNVKAVYSTDKLDAVNDVFLRMRQGQINGRVVLEVGS